MMGKEDVPHGLQMRVVISLFSCGVDILSVGVECLTVVNETDCLFLLAVLGGKGGLLEDKGEEEEEDDEENEPEACRLFPLGKAVSVTDIGLSSSRSDG